MRSRIRPALLLLPGFLAVAAGANPVRATGPALWSAGTLSLRASGDEYLLTTAGLERQVALPRGVEVEELFPLRQGAFLSGLGASVPQESGAAPRRDLFLALVDERGLRPLPSPALTAGAGRVRENAVPLASVAGDLEGVVWLEGADRQSYAVRYAAWEGASWGEPRTIAAAAPGSQLALGGATLGDGSQLLVWSRFDGKDDEIVAARFTDGRWSPALPLAADNAVPDITPSVLAVPGGALATWSRYDGHDYRVMMSRFDGREWTTPAWAGPAGSTYPALLPPGPAGEDRAHSAPAAYLIYATARERGWTVVEVDSAGRALRRGIAGQAPGARPALATTASGEIRLRWATGDRAVELH